MKKCYALILSLFFVFLIAITAPVSFNMQAQAASSTSASQSIKLNKTKASVYNGKTLKLKVSGTKETVKWSSADKSIATVSKKGVVTPKKPGTVKIRAKVAGKTLTCKVTVKSPLSVSETNLTIALNKSKTVTVNYVLDGELSYRVAKAGTVVCKWGKWDGNKIKLKLTAKKPGTTNVSITNTETDDYLKLKVTVPCTHSFGPWEVTSEATTAKAGVETRVCTICGKKETRSVTLKVGESYLSPLSGQSGQVIEYQPSANAPVRKLKITVNNILTGSAANQLAESENSYNDDPGAGYNWMFLFFRVDYISSTNGLNDSLDLWYIVNDDEAFFTASGSTLPIKDDATLGNRFASNMHPVYIEMHPGASIDCVYGILIPSSQQNILLRVPKNSGKSFTWISMKAPEWNSSSSYDPNPTSPADTPTPTPVSTNSITRNLTRLREYIQDYGSLNDDYNPFIRIDSDQFSAGIVYDTDMEESEINVTYDED